MSHTDNANIRKHVHSCYVYATVLVRYVGFLSTYLVRLCYVNFYLAATVHVHVHVYVEGYINYK